MEDKILQIAQEYAIKNGKDTIRSAGVRNGYQYFHVFLKATCGHKLGIYQYIKISTTGKVTEVLNRQEIMWAHQQEVSLHAL